MRRVPEPPALALAPALTPRGHLHLEPSVEGARLDPDLTARLETAFARGAGHGLLQLGAAEVATPLPPALRYWRDFAVRYVTAVCTHSTIEAETLPALLPAPPPP